MTDVPYNPVDDFEHQLLLTCFSLASHSLRVLGNAGLLDDTAKAIMRLHLQMLQAKIDAMPDHTHRDFFLQYPDTLTAVLPPTKRANG